MAEKVALITGGARRVGAAIGRLLHHDGMSLMVHYRSSAEQARALQAELNAVRADSVALVQADLLNAASLPALVNETLQQFGRLDVLINNASSFFPSVVGEISEREWDDLMGTNLKTPLFLSQAAAPHLRQEPWLHREHHRHPRRPADAQLCRIQCREGRPAGVDPLAGRRAGSGGAGQRRVAGRDHLARGRTLVRRAGAPAHRSDHAAQTHRGSRRHRAHRALPGVRCTIRHRPGHRCRRRAQYSLVQPWTSADATTKTTSSPSACAALVGQAIADFDMIARGRSRDGVPVRRQGQLRAARCAAQPAGARARSTSRSSPSTSTSATRAFPADVLPRLPALAGRALPHRGAGHLQRGQARDPRGQDHVQRCARGCGAA